MDTPGYIVLSRLAAQRRATDVLAANIANAGTPGFKASQAVFAAELTRQTGIDAPRGGQSLAFTQDRATWRNMANGSLQHTGNPLDLALSGDGYFVVNTPRGERFTRAGHFTLSPQSQVVDPDGNPVLSEAGEPLTLPPGDVRIEVKGDGSIGSESGPLGRLRVVRFEDPQKLIAEGNRLLAAPPDQRPEPELAPRVVQGAVEESNVSAVAELTRLTAGMREFQFASQFLEKEGERLGSAVDRILKRR
ncbi:flagellar hook basal-body protein [Roseomonas frigidaquae]|uniref:Flagellar hook basal-body protein n=1 Tax=Falsiroseomonas frigidaquae TaxID=487318 RepID=A0ABX1EW90_9PROT|nr:flagellar hook basal-body protein [Falsiroseomonas frigidaquae]NKE43282.1 flagellar hook basal-body protein [Falsiroseomonas frigidaquae]